MDYATLKADILSGPHASVLAPLAGIEADPDGRNPAPYPFSQDGTIAAWYNDPIGPGAGLIEIPSMTGDQFVTGILPALLALPAASSAIQAKWQPLIQVMLSRQNINTPVIDPILAGVVADGLITQVQVDAFTKRQGSYAEVLFGAGASISNTDVACALGRV